MPRTPPSTSPGRSALPATARLLLVVLGGGALAGCPNGEGGSESATEGDTKGCDAGLAAGDLVFTEVMPDPDGADDGKEWFELYNASGDSLNLRGATLAYSRTNGDGVKSHTIGVDLIVAPGQYMTFGDMLPEATPPHVDYGYANDLGALGNTAGRLQVVCGEVVVDQILYTDIKQKFSRSLDGAFAPTSTLSSDQNNWCNASEVYDLISGDLGTPRAANPPCPLPDPPQGQCWDGDLLRPIVTPGPGDLVITEHLADPVVVDDANGEWFEVLALAAVDLNELGLGKEPLNVLDSVQSPECQRVSPGDLVVFARKADPAVNGGLPQVDHLFGFALNNSNSGIFLSNSDGELIDAITYTSTGAGIASGVDPTQATAEANDDLDAWCPATMVYGDGDLGSPGLINPSCPLPPPDDQCQENGEWRDIRFPEVGDLVITELMPDPAAVGDAVGEWVEIYVGAEVDLNRLVLGKEPGSQVLQTLGGDDPTCLPVAAGSFILLANNDDPAVNGGLPEPTYPLAITLTNSSMPLYVALPGVDNDTPGDLLDAITYSGPKAGLSRSLDPSQLNPEANDDLANWCDAAAGDVYGAGDRGTPGAANTPCEGGGGGGECNDGGESRDPIAPGPGDLSLTEIMADPTKVADGVGEWFELEIHGTFDLNNLEFRRQPDTISQTLVAADCLTVAPGDRVVFGRDADPAVNGGIPQVDHLFTFNLVNSNGALYVTHDGEPLDSYTYAKATAGVADSRDPNGVDWCLAIDPYGDGDLGTPGGANPACEGGMMMEGTCLDGGEPREPVLPGPGALVITEFMADPVQVADAAGEWIEVVALEAVDLNGLKVAKFAEDLAGASGWASASCLSVVPGDYVLIARSTDPAVNGGLPEVDHTFSFNLTNASGGVAIGVGEVLIDAVTYTGSSAGKSHSLDPNFYDADLNDNASMAPWCLAVAAYGDGDLGTPKVENPTCP